MNGAELMADFLYVLQESALALLPLALISAVLQVVLLKLPRRFVFNAFIGLVLAFVGLFLFLYGVRIGFMPAGIEIGRRLGGHSHKWVLIPIGSLFGFLAVVAEPAVRIQCEEVENESSGYVPARVLLFTIAAGVSAITAVGMARAIWNVPFKYLALGGYGLAIVVLIAFRPRFAPVAFDAGGVATGPMTVSFMVAVMIGLSEALGHGDPVGESFGLVALVALAPILSVMMLSMLYTRKERRLDEP